MRPPPTTRPAIITYSSGSLFLIITVTVSSTGKMSREYASHRLSFTLSFSFSFHLSFSSSCLIFFSLSLVSLFTFRRVLTLSPCSFNFLYTVLSSVSLSLTLCSVFSLSRVASLSPDSLVRFVSSSPSFFLTFSRNGQETDPWRKSGGSRRYSS